MGKQHGSEGPIGEDEFSYFFLLLLLLLLPLLPLLFKRQLPDGKTPWQ